MTWYIFPTRKEDRIVVLIIIATALLFRVCIYPFLSNPYWLLFFEIGGIVLTVYLWVFALIFFKAYYSNKLKELQKELERLKKDE